MSVDDVSSLHVGLRRPAAASAAASPVPISPAASAPVVDAAPVVDPVAAATKKEVAACPGIEGKYEVQITKKNPEASSSVAASPAAKKGGSRRRQRRHAKKSKKRANKRRTRSRSRSRK